MPRKQIASFPDTASVAATDRLVIQKGTTGAVFENATVTQLFASGVEATHSAVTLTGTAVPEEGLFRPASNTLGFAVDGFSEMLLTPAALTPASNDTLQLGSSSVMWSDFFLASGGVINFNNGNVTLTHSTGTLTLAGDMAVSGNVVPSRSTAISAAGTSQATATALTAQINIVTTVSAGQGVVLADRDAVVMNRGTVDLLVYPPTGAQIEAYGTNAAVALPVNGAGNFIRSSSTLFRVF